MSQPPSIFSSLFNKPSVRVDRDLVSIFNSSAGPSSASVKQPLNSVSEARPSGLKVTKKESKHGKPPVIPNDRPFKQNSTPSKKTIVSKTIQLDDESDEDEDDPALEDAYLRRGFKQSTEPTATVVDHAIDEEQDGTSLPIHETLSRSSKTRIKSERRNYKPDTETKEERDFRTIFVGNLPISLAKEKKHGTKLLIRFLKEHSPLCKVESVRFRSIAFQAPTSRLEEDNSTTPSSTRKSDSDGPTTKEQRQSERAARWRGDSEPDKVYLSDKQKKRIAFITRKIHNQAGTVNAYVVLAYPDPMQSLNVPRCIDPHEAVDQLVAKCDGITFMERTIRVDRLGTTTNTIQSGNGDAKATIFIGGLDFSAQEEDLRTYFETVITSQLETFKGMSSDGMIKHVRIVRDGKTLLGKGFAYIEFNDRSVVDEILSLEKGSMKFAKRSLRVQRCKTSGAASRQRQEAKIEATNTAPAASIPKGDPLLGEKLRELGKDERKAVKASDAVRVARRLAKKKARHGMKMNEATKNRIESRKSSNVKRGNGSLNRRVKA